MAKSVVLRVWRLAVGRAGLTVQGLAVRSGWTVRPEASGRRRQPAGGGTGHCESEDQSATPRPMNCRSRSQALPHRDWRWRVQAADASDAGQQDEHDAARGFARHQQQAADQPQHTDDRVQRPNPLQAADAVLCTALTQSIGELSILSAASKARNAECPQSPARPTARSPAVMAVPLLGGPNLGPP